MDRGRVYEPPPLAKGLLAVNGCWGARKFFFFSSDVAFFFSEVATVKLIMP